MPLAFFAMHEEKTPENEDTLEIWTEIWSENSPGTESGIRQNLKEICETLKVSLESPSWTMKAQVSFNINFLNKISLDFVAGCQCSEHGSK